MESNENKVETTKRNAGWSQRSCKKTKVGLKTGIMVLGGVCSLFTSIGVFGLMSNQNNTLTERYDVYTIHYSGGVGTASINLSENITIHYNVGLSNYGNNKQIAHSVSSGGGDVIKDIDVVSVDQTFQSFSQGFVLQQSNSIKIIQNDINKLPVADFRNSSDHTTIVNSWKTKQKVLQRSIKSMEGVMVWLPASNGLFITTTVLLLVGIITLFGIYWEPRKKVFRVTSE